MGDATYTTSPSECEGTERDTPMAWSLTWLFKIAIFWVISSMVQSDEIAAAPRYATLLNIVYSSHEGFSIVGVVADNFDPAVSILLGGLGVVFLLLAPVLPQVLSVASPRAGTVLSEGDCGEGTLKGCLLAVVRCGCCKPRLPLVEGGETTHDWDEVTSWAVFPALPFCAGLGVEEEALSGEASNDFRIAESFSWVTLSPTSLSTWKTLKIAGH